MIPSDVGAAYRVRLPAQLVRGADSVTRLEPRLGAALLAQSATYRVLGPDGTAVASGLTATCIGGVAVVTVPAASLPSTLGYGRGYREEWTVTLTSGQVHVVARPAAVVRYALYCPVTLADLQAEYPDIEVWISTSDATAPQQIGDGAWEDVLHRLSGDGRWVNTIVDVDALIAPVRELWLAKWFRFRSASSGVGSQDDTLAVRHAEAYERAYSAMRFTVDTDQDGIADSEQRVSGAGTVLGRGQGRAWQWSSTARLTSRGRVL